MSFDFATWLGAAGGLVIGLIIHDAALEAGIRLTRRLTPGVTQREAEAQKMGELQAIRKQLDDIVEQARRTTEVQAQIQAQISGQLWKEQMHMTQKRDIYASLFKTIATMRVLAGQLEMSWDAEGGDRQSPEVARLLDQFIQYETDLEATLGLARCFLSEAAMKSLDLERYERRFQSGDSIQVRRGTLLKLEFALVAAARDDLGISRE